MSAMSGHTITVEFDRVSPFPTLTFDCHEGPEAGCRQMCPRSECEEGCTKPDEHTTEPLDYCNVVEWLSNTDDIETCLADQSTTITAPIEYVWSADYPGPDWRFKSAEATP